MSARRLDAAKMTGTHGGGALGKNAAGGCVRRRVCARGRACCLGKHERADPDDYLVEHARMPPRKNRRVRPRRRARRGIGRCAAAPRNGGGIRRTCARQSAALPRFGRFWRKCRLTAFEGISWLDALNEGDGAVVPHANGRVRGGIEWWRSRRANC